MSPHLTSHVKQRMAQRGISEEDLESALSRTTGPPRPAGFGKVWVFGYAATGRILKVLVTTEQDVVITAAWPDTDGESE